MPRLSVLMPAYNAASSVGPAARSTLRALPADAELVVLDDGSTDSTAAALSKIDDPRLRVLSRENRGVAAALNDLLNSTDSALVARMDADDLCLPRRLHRQVQAARRADVVFTTVRPWNGTDRPGLARPHGLTTAEFPFHLLLTNPVAHSSMLARREVLDAVGGYRSVPSEDYDLWLRLAASQARMGRLALPGLAYRAHGSQITAASDWRERSWRDPLTADSFSTLAECLIEIPAMRVTTLSIAPLPLEDKLRRFDEFAQAVRRAAERLPVLARRRLRRRLDERERWLRQAVGLPPDPVAAAEGRVP